MTRYIALRLLSEQACVLFCFFSLRLPSSPCHTCTHARTRTRSDKRLRAFHFPTYVQTQTCGRTHTHISICCQTIAHRLESGVDYYVIALHWQKVNPFPSIPWWPMVVWRRVGGGMGPDRLLMASLRNTPISVLFVFDCNQDNVLTWHSRWN